MNNLKYSQRLNPQPSTKNILSQQTHPCALFVQSFPLRFVLVHQKIFSHIIRCCISWWQQWWRSTKLGSLLRFLSWCFIKQPQQRAYLQLPSHLVQVEQIQIWSFLFNIMTLSFVQEQSLQFFPASSLRWNHNQLNHLCRQMSTMEEKTVMC